ncbi:hypothetical protein GCM10010195_74850 [Kitasatospora griseola]|nr:hypothetical protein GCM10010195_74850 [Kitasatospora griseola]
MPVYWPGGVRHEGGVSLICWSCTERGKACFDTAAREGGERERPKRLNRKGLSTVAKGAGGPARSSAEAPVTEVERRGRVIRGCVCLVNRKFSGRSRWTS